MSRVNEYYAWLLKRAKDNWLEAQAAADKAERENAQGKDAWRTWANAAYEVYSTIVQDDPGNYSAHKRTTHSRRARRRWLS